jgi:hypothetical protein
MKPIWPKSTLGRREASNSAGSVMRLNAIRMPHATAMMSRLTCGARQDFVRDLRAGVAGQDWRAAVAGIDAL